MLYVNGELLNVASKDKGYKLAKQAEDYQKSIAELRKEYGSKIKIKSTRKIRTDNDGKAKPIPPRSFPLEVTFFNQEDHASEEWVYSEKFLSLKDGKFADGHERTYKIINGELFLDLDKDPGLAYYLIFKSGKVGDESAKYVIDNPRSKNKRRANTQAREAKLLYVIYNELDKTKLSVLAKSYGIPNVDTLDVEEIKNYLYDEVKRQEALVATNKDAKARGIDAFMRDSDLDLRTQIAALVQDSRDKGVVNYNAIERRWEIEYNDNSAPYIITEISREDVYRPVDVLVDFLHADQKSLEKLKKAMGVAGLVSIGVELDIILKEKNPQKLKKIAREYCSFEVTNNAKVADLKYKIISELFGEDTAKLNLVED